MNTVVSTGNYILWIVFVSYYCEVSHIHINFIAPPKIDQSWPKNENYSIDTDRVRIINLNKNCPIHFNWKALDIFPHLQYVVFHIDCKLFCLVVPEKFFGAVKFVNICVARYY